MRNRIEKHNASRTKNALQSNQPAAKTSSNVFLLRQSSRIVPEASFELGTARGIAAEMHVGNGRIPMNRRIGNPSEEDGGRLKFVVRLLISQRQVPGPQDEETVLSLEG